MKRSTETVLIMAATFVLFALFGCESVPGGEWSFSFSRSIEHREPDAVEDSDVEDED